MSSDQPPQPHSHQPQAEIQQCPVCPPEPPISAPQLTSPAQKSPPQSSTPTQVRPGPPPTPETSKKRARPTVSCFECRRKKLKCDRVQPCSQCVKGHREGLCQFATGVTKVGVSGAPTRAGDIGSDGGGERVAKRVRGDEGALQNIAIGKERVDEVGRRNAGSSDAPMSTLGRIYVKGNRSRYLGIGDRMAMLDHFEDARSYVMSCFEDPETRGLMQELTVYQNSFQRKPKKPHIDLPPDRASLVSEMLKSLSTESSFSSAYMIYEMHWEGLTRVMHKQTLLRESEELQVFLKSHQSVDNYSLPANIRESLIPQMIGILALSARLNKAVSNTNSEDQVSAWMEMIQRWLDGLKGKERLNIQILRTQILLLQLRMNNLAQTSDLWKESGTLVRSAMIVGLHQDPENYDEFSIFEKEQRRKLWRTIVELDMQFSLAGGMPSATRSSDFNSRPLRNVDDFSLKEDMLTYPENKAERLWTDALAQVILSASMKERLDATNILAGNVSLVEDVEKLLSLARFFEHSLQELPTPSRAEEAWGQRNERDPGKLFMKIMLDVQLRRPTLCMYQYIMLSEQGGRYPEARKGAVRSAVAMLNHLDALDPEVADPNTIKNRDQLNLLHLLCKKDIIQAALILCLEIRSFSLASREGERRVNGVQILQDELLPWTKTSLTRIVENTLNSLLQRLGEFGSDLKDILPLIVVLQSARSDGTPEDKKLLMRKGTERILKACREALPHIAHTPAASHNGSARSPSSNRQHAPARPALPQTYNPSHYQLIDKLNAGAKNGFVDFNMLPGTDLAFQDFDFGFADWDMCGSWF